MGRQFSSSCQELFGVGVQAVLGVQRALAVAHKGVLQPPPHPRAPIKGQQNGAVPGSGRGEEEGQEAAGQEAAGQLLTKM